jgi:ABC-type multidrug transport system ATPase subunit
MEEAFKVLGVCPQVDPIIDELSGRDHLLFFGRVKGVPEASLAITVDNLLRRLGLNPFDAKKKAGEYSGGMKRKLSVGIALIGHSRMLFLDEPSAAVDAGAKRHLWKVIKNRASDQTVVLTTHSMEEAEALCDRLAIQVKGQLRCLGTPMHIRNKYGFGYQLELFVSAQDEGVSRQGSRSFKEAAGCGPSSQVLSFMTTQISPGAVLMEFHAERYLFRLPPLSRDCSLGKIISAITASKASIGIKDWSIERPTLEQVFLRFAKEQEEQSQE